MLQTIKTFIFGERVKGEVLEQPSFKTIVPENKPSFIEWCRDVNFGLLFDRKTIHLDEVVDMEEYDELEIAIIKTHPNFDQLKWDEYCDEGRHYEEYDKLLIWATIVAVITAYPVMWLWNGCLVGTIDGVHEITFFKALGLAVLCALLFKPGIGGFVFVEGSENKVKEWWWNNLKARKQVMNKEQIKQIKQLTDFLNKISFINSGGCGIAALAIYDLAEKLGLKPEILFLYSWNRHGEKENKEYIKGLREKAESCGHVVVRIGKILIDSEDFWEKEHPKFNKTTPIHEINNMSELHDFLMYECHVQTSERAQIWFDMLCELEDAE
ncbi:unnamed protein product [Wuchereria bancrofti]|uniref:Uncharacterized protein n=1 Tax=Wuchereria bancrofti TaxID=6293 RepID=A0A3P7DBE1_WUCBA|nr:unnamed protein product [Wuchereria bancrofti]